MTTEVQFFEYMYFKLEVFVIYVFYGNFTAVLWNIGNSFKVHVYLFTTDYLIYLIVIIVFQKLLFFSL